MLNEDECSICGEQGVVRSAGRGLSAQWLGFPLIAACSVSRVAAGVLRRSVPAVVPPGLPGGGRVAAAGGQVVLLGGVRQRRGEPTQALSTS